MFQLLQKVKVAYGSGCIRELGPLVKEMQLHKVLILCDPVLVSSGIVGKAQASLAAAGIDAVIFDKVEPEPRHTIPEEGYARYQAEGCDAVVGIGGGSCMDVAKAVNILRFNPGRILDYAKPGAEMQPAPGLILVPTTAGTGSELSDGVVVSDDEHIKQGILAPNGMAEYAFLDPELMESMPPGLTASTGLDAFSHACEGYTSGAATLITDMINEKCMESVVKWLPVAVANGKDMEARGHMAVAAAMGGWMLGYSHTNGGHSVAHMLSSHYGIPHGLACGYATPWVLAFNAQAMPEKVRWIGVLLGAEFRGGETPEEIGARTCQAFIDFRDKALNVPSASRYDVDKGTFPQVAQEISEEMFQAFQPREMRARDAEEILQRIFA